MYLICGGKRPPDDGLVIVVAVAIVIVVAVIVALARRVFDDTFDGFDDVLRAFDKASRFGGLRTPDLRVHLQLEDTQHKLADAPALAVERGFGRLETDQ